MTNWDLDPEEVNPWNDDSSLLFGRDTYHDRAYEFLCEKGMTVPEVAAILGVSRRLVYKRGEELGLSFKAQAQQNQRACRRLTSTKRTVYCKNYEECMASPYEAAPCEKPLRATGTPDEIRAAYGLSLEEVERECLRLGLTLHQK